MRKIIIKLTLVGCVIIALQINSCLSPVSGDWEYGEVVCVFIDSMVLPDTITSQEALTIRLRGNNTYGYYDLYRLEADRNTTVLGLRAWIRLKDWQGDGPFPPVSTDIEIMHQVQPPFYKSIFIVNYIQPDSAILSDTVNVIK